MVGIDKRLWKWEKGEISNSYKQIDYQKTK